MNVSRIRMQSLGLALVVFYFLYFLLFVFTLPAMAAGAKTETGFLVLAPDRGFLGNKETLDVMAQFKKDYPASFAPLGRDSQGH